MRKGADILSKWVGEAERQLRLLFEEAQRQQPAIIFFDEIDGLAPVSCAGPLHCLAYDLSACTYPGAYGKAEGQLRLLLEEAQLQQPAIIFFDEINGLAPVRGFLSSLASWPIRGL